MDLTIRRLTLDDLDSFYQHLERSVAAGSTHGAPPFTPLGQSTIFSDVDKQYERQGWLTPPNQPKWIRVWGAFLDQKLIGHIKLKGAHAQSQIHRCFLSIGIENHKLRGTGIGSALMHTACTWASDQASLDWIDLSVFDTNPRATSLYKKFGFIEYGYKNDDYQIEGKSYNHVLMTLDLREMDLAHEAKH